MTDRSNADEVMEKAAARIEEIYRAAVRIEDAVNRLAGDGKGAAGIGPPVGSALERLSQEIGEIRNLQGEAVGILLAVREEVGKIVSAGPDDFTGGLGPDGLR